LPASKTRSDGGGEVFWIGEVCDADRRNKLITKEAREWFATRTISQAIVSYQEKTTAATVAEE